MKSKRIVRFILFYILICFTGIVLFQTVMSISVFSKSLELWQENKVETSALADKIIIYKYPFSITSGFSRFFLGLKCYKNPNLNYSSMELLPANSQQVFYKTIHPIYTDWFLLINMVLCFTILISWRKVAEEDFINRKTKKNGHVIFFILNFCILFASIFVRIENSATFLILSGFNLAAVIIQAALTIWILKNSNEASRNSEIDESSLMFIGKSGKIYPANVILVLIFLISPPVYAVYLNYIV